jgi:purine-binding chemotaxis protein CheW
MSHGMPSLGPHRQAAGLTVVSSDVASAPRAAGTMARGPVLASFLLGTLEFAVHVRDVQEVVRRPGRVMAIPLLPDYAEGVIDLRGSIIPVLRTGVLLGAQSSCAPEDAKIAIVVHHGIRLGLLCDDTGRVLRPRAEDIVPLQYAEGSPHGVCSAVLKTPDGLLSVVDLERLIGLHGVPQAHPDAATGEIRSALARGRRQRRCISFRVASSGLALPIEQIHEIVPLDALEASPIPDPATAGLMRIRGTTVPVVRFGRLLGLEAGADAPVVRSEASRVIVLQAESIRVGLLTDAVDAIEAYSDEQCLRVPVLRQEHQGLYAGCIDFGDRGHRLLMDAEALLKFEPIARVAQQHQLLCDDKPVRLAASKAKGQRQTFLWFQSGHGFAMALQDIREIVPLTSGLTQMPGAPDHVVGMINLRGTLVPVFDLRRFYRLPESSTPGEDEAKILVLQHGAELLGLRVDSIRSMLHVNAGDRLEVPALMRITLPPALRDDIREVVRAIDADGQSLDLLVVNVKRMVTSSIAAAGASEPCSAAA